MDSTVFNKFRKFTHILKEKYGYEVNENGTSMFPGFIYFSFKKELGYGCLFINVNLSKDEITYYKTYNLTANNIEELSEQLDRCNYYTSPHAYQVSFELNKFVMENIEVLKEFSDEIKRERKERKR